MLKKGIIVSIQGKSLNTTIEIAKDIIRAGACAIKTDKPLKKYLDYNIDIIGCKKIRVNNPEKEIYLTPEISIIKDVASWSDYVSIDFRRFNKNIKQISNYCRENKINVVADIGSFADYENIKKNDLYYTYIATTFTVFDPGYRFYPHLELAKRIRKEEKNIIAEGNFKTRSQVREMYISDINNICIGGAITDIYKLSRKFTTVTKEREK